MDDTVSGADPADIANDDRAPLSHAELGELLARTDPDAPPVSDAELARINDAPGGPPDEFAGDPNWAKINDAFPTDDVLLESIVAGQEHRREEIERALGTGAVLRENFAYAARAYQALQSPELDALFDGAVDSLQLLKVAAKLGRRYVRGTEAITEKGYRPLGENEEPRLAALSRDQSDRVQLAIDKIYEEHRGRASMTSEPVQRQLRKLFKAKIQGANPLP